MPVAVEASTVAAGISARWRPSSEPFTEKMAQRSLDQVIA